MQTRSLNFSRRSAPERRALDIASGFALGILLMLLVQLAHASSTSPIPTSAAPTSTDWLTGPWSACTISAESIEDQHYGNTVTHVVSGQWVCSQSVPLTFPFPSPTP